eukprot:250541_1
MHSLIVTMLSALIMINLWLNQSAEANGLCPRGFVFLLYEGEKTTLSSQQLGSIYVTFGRPRFYSLSMIRLIGDDNEFACDSKFFGSVSNVLDNDDTEEYSHVSTRLKRFWQSKDREFETPKKRKNLCCICAFKHAEKAEMLLFPTDYTQTIHTKTAEEWVIRSDKHLKVGLNWIQYTVAVGDKKRAIALALTSRYDSTCETMMRDLNIEALTFKHGGKYVCKSKHVQLHDPIKGEYCYPSLERCNTKHHSGLIVFLLNYRAVPGARPDQFIKAAYSVTGIYDVIELFKHMKPLKPSEMGLVTHIPMYKFWEQVDKPLPTYVHTTATVEWKLASFCASCPGTSVTITTSDKKVKTQKRRLQFAQTTNVQAKWTGGVGVPGAKTEMELGMGKSWTSSFFQELDEALSSGTTASIQAQCNGFYLYHFDVQIGSPRSEFVSIPTRYFYCTDKPYPPKCVPRLAGHNPSGESESFLSVCQGDDTNHDFDIPDTNNDQDKAWRSFHSGRPKPLRIVAMPQGKDSHAAIAASGEPAELTISNEGQLKLNDMVWISEIPKPDTAPAKVFFEGQTTHNTCLRHAINNLFGKKSAVKDAWLNDVAVILANSMHAPKSYAHSLDAPRAKMIGPKTESMSEKRKAHSMDAIDAKKKMKIMTESMSEKRKAHSRDAPKAEMIGSKTESMSEKRKAHSRDAPKAEMIGSKTESMSEKRKAHSRDAPKAEMIGSKTESMSEKRKAELCLAAADAHLMDYSGGFWSVDVATNFLKLAKCGLQSHDGNGATHDAAVLNEPHWQSWKDDPKFVGFLMNESRMHWFTIKWFAYVGKWYRLDSLQSEPLELDNDEAVLRILKDAYTTGGYFGIVKENE